MITKALWIILKYLVIFFINKALLLFIGIESSANINLLIGFISILLSLLSIKVLFKIIVFYVIIILFNNIFKITTGNDLLLSLYDYIINIPYKNLIPDRNLTPNIDEKKCITNSVPIVLWLIIVFSIIMPIIIKMYRM